MNIKKTKVMFNNYIPHHGIKVDDEIIECEFDYIYLGQEINASLVHEKISKVNKDGLECI